MKNIANYYIAFTMLYYLQGALYTGGGWLSRTLLVFILAISIYYFFYAITKYNLPKPMKIMAVLMAVFSIYGLIPMIIGVGAVKVGVQSFQFLKFILLSQLPIYVFYVFFKKQWLTEAMIRKWFFVFGAVAIAGFYYSNNTMLLDAMSMGSDRTEFTNNDAYTVLTLMCLLPLFYKKPILQYTFMAICLYYVIMGFKRGAIIAGTVCALWLIVQTFLENDSSQKKSVGKQIIRLLLTIAIVIGVVYVVQGLFLSSDYFNMRFDKTMDGDSSGRDNYYSFFFNYIINEQGPVNFLLGNGVYGALVVFGDGAHNDWLEIAFSCGIITMFIYLAYWISMISMFVNGNKRSTTVIMLGIFIIIYLLKTFYSISYTTVTPYAAIAFSYAMVNYEYKDKFRRIA